jgi:hypothetical protein
VKDELGPAADGPEALGVELSPNTDEPVSTTGGVLPGLAELLAAGDRPFPVAKGLFPWRGDVFRVGPEPCARGETGVGAGKPKAAADSVAEGDAGQKEPAEAASGPDWEEADDAVPDAEAAAPDDEAADDAEGDEGSGNEDEEAAEETDRGEPAPARPGADGELTAAGRRSGGGGVTDDEAGSKITDCSGRGATAGDTTAVPRTARRGPINRAARVNTLRVAVSYPSR